MRCSDAGLDIIKQYESCELEPYRDPIGIWTIGWGAIYGLDGARVIRHHPAITQEQADDLLRRDVQRAERAVDRLVTQPLTQAQFDALVSFTFNVGSGNLMASTLRQKINCGEYDEAADEFPKWRRAGGVILKGLVRRRSSERELFLSP